MLPAGGSSSGSPSNPFNLPPPPSAHLLQQLHQLSPTQRDIFNSTYAALLSGAQLRSAHHPSTRSATVQSQPLSPPPTPVNVKTDDKRKIFKGRNFLEAEDKRLCQVWTSVSEDAIIGTSQKADTFWKRVEALYNENPPAGQRDDKSLSNRWNSVQKKVQKFISCYKTISRSRPSGCTEADLLPLALEKYHQIHHTKFTLVHCFAELKDLPKFGAMASDTESSEPTVSRPMGAKATKKLKRKLEEEEDGHALEKEQTELAREHILLEKRKLEFQEKKFAREEMDAELARVEKLRVLFGDNDVIVQKAIEKLREKLST